MGNTGDALEEQKMFCTFKVRKSMSSLYKGVLLLILLLLLVIHIC